MSDFIESDALPALDSAKIHCSNFDQMIYISF